MLHRLTSINENKVPKQPSGFYLARGSIDLYFTLCSLLEMRHIHPHSKIVVSGPERDKKSPVKKFLELHSKLQEETTRLEFNDAPIHGWEIHFRPNRLNSATQYSPPEEYFGKAGEPPATIALILVGA